MSAFFCLLLQFVALMAKTCKMASRLAKIEDYYTIVSNSELYALGIKKALKNKIVLRLSGGMHDLLYEPINSLTYFPPTAL